MEIEDRHSAKNHADSARLKNALLLDENEFVSLLIDKQCGGILDWCYAGDIDRAFDLLERMDSNGGNSITTTKESRMSDYRFCQCDVEYPEVIGESK